MSRCSSAIDNWRWAGVPFYLRTGKALTPAHDRDRDPVQTGAVRAVPRHAGRATDPECAGAADPAGRGDLAAVRRQDSRGRRCRLGGVRDGLQLCGLFPHRSRAPATRRWSMTHDRRRDAVPARRQHRGGLEHRAADPRCLGRRAGLHWRPMRPAVPGPEEAEALIDSLRCRWRPL